MPPAAPVPPQQSLREPQMSHQRQPKPPDAWDKVLNIGPVSGTIIMRPKAPLETPRKPLKIAPSPLRIAQENEEDDLMEFCHELWEENGKEFFSFDADKVRGHLRRSFEKTGGLMVVIGPPGKVEGGCLLLIDPYYYTSDFALFELFNFVRPDYRNSAHAKTLITWAMNQADKLRLLLFIGILSNSRTIGKVRLYRRVLGVDPSGAYFVYRPKSLYNQPNGAHH
jgi:hypothetical protein